MLARRPGTVSSLSISALLIMTLFWCGYNMSVFAALAFLQPAVYWNACSSRNEDILVFGLHGPCKCDASKFNGAILSVNGEDDVTRLLTPKTVQIGVGGYPLPYGAVEWVNKNLTQFNGSVVHNAVAYANTNCVSKREHMAEQLAKKVTVHAFGKCDGNGKATRIKRSGTWPDNSRLFQGYAFVLAAEHGVTTNYVSEKPFVAASAGAIPIYWGSDLIKSYMSSQRVLVWNSSTADVVSRLIKTRDYAQIRNKQAVNMPAIQAAIGVVVDRVLALQI